MSQKSFLAFTAANAISKPADIDFIGVRGRLYRYEGGVYRPCEDDVRREAQHFLGDNSEQSVLNEVVHRLRNDFHVEADLVDTTDLINVQNGLLHWPSGTLFPHSPRVFSTVQLPVNWNPDAFDERGDRFLNEVLSSPEARLVVEELLGYTLRCDCRFEKAAMFTGSGANGKSTMLDWMTATLGAENVSAVSLHDLCRERFRLALVIGKLANVFADLPSRSLADTGTFKALVSGDYLTAEHKHQPLFKFRNRAKLIFSTNDLPAASDASPAYFRRWVIVDFPHSFPEGDPRRDPKLGDKLATDSARSYLLRLGVEGARRLEANGSFTQTPEGKAAIAAYQREVDTVRAFMEEECEVEPGSEAPKTAVYERYRDWAERNGLRAEAHPMFGRRLRALVPNLDEYQPRHGGGRQRRYVGVGLVSEGFVQAP